MHHSKHYGYWFSDTWRVIHDDVITFSTLLAICAGNSSVPGEFPAQRLLTRSFEVFFDLRLNKRLSKQSWGWWVKTLSRPLWRHSNTVLSFKSLNKYTKTSALMVSDLTVFNQFPFLNITGGNRTKLPSSRWLRRGRSLREVFACSCFLATTDLAQICNTETRRHCTRCTKTTDSYLLSFLYNDPRKIRRETTVGKCVPNNGRRYLNWVTTVDWGTTTVASVA